MDSQTRTDGREDCVCEVHSHTWREAQQLLWSFASGGRELYFRGQADARWRLVSKFGRLMETLAKQRELHGEDLRASEQQLETRLLEEFKKAYFRIVGGATLPEDNDGLRAVAQHHGLPTRLLDWTRSPYIAAFFAFDGCKTTVFPADHKVAIWVFDWEMFELLLCYGFKGTDQEQIVSDRPGDFDETLRAIRESPWPRIDKIPISAAVSRRMVHQEGFFTRAVKAKDDIENYLRAKSTFAPGTVLTKIVIRGAEQASALRDLSLMAINPVSLMNDPDAAAATAFNAVVRFNSD